MQGFLNGEILLKAEILQIFFTIVYSNDFILAVVVAANFETVDGRAHH
jgi:hypothetical protein